MKMIRKLILSYSPDQERKKDRFLVEYQLHKSSLQKRHVQFSKKKVTTRSQLFQISLYGYDGQLKYITNKINSLPTILRKIDSMPMGHLEKLKSIELYTDSHPNTTVKGTGFKDEKTAKKTLKLIQHKPVRYQFLVVNTLYHRAKYHPHQTSDMKRAMKVFKSWLKTYKLKKTKRQNAGTKSLPYLPLKLVNEYEKLAEYYNVSRKARGLEKPTTSDEGFLVVYRRMKGDGKKMEGIPCREDKPEGVDWERKREVEVLGKLGQAKRMKLELFHKSGPLKGLPTIIHTNMIMWAFSPYPQLLIKNKKLLENIK
jgi:hypothetical protein